MVMRLQEYHNELVSLVEFECRKVGGLQPTHAVFLDDVPGGKVVIPVFGEDLSAMKRAGYTVAHSAGDIEPPIPAYIHSDRDRLAAIVANDGETFDIRRRGAAREDDASPAFAPFPAPRQAEPEPMNGAGAHGMAPLYTKIAKVMGSIGHIEKRGRNLSQGWTYVTDEDLYAAVRREMAAVKLAMLPPRNNGLRTEKDGVYIDLIFTLACADSGLTLSTPWIGKLSNSTPQAIAATITNNIKYFLKSTFLISTGDPNDDTDSGLHEAENVKPQPPVAKPKAKTAPAGQLTEQPDPWLRGNGAPAATPGEDKPAPSSGKPGKDQRAHVFLHKFDEPFDISAFWTAIKTMSWQAEAHKFRTLNKMWEDGELGPAMTVAEAVASVMAHLNAADGEGSVS